jgi:ankyrin repeat protein
LSGNPGLVSSKDAGGRTPLFGAVANGHNEAIEFLLANKADPNIRDNRGITPLHLAVIDGREEAVELLLANKADVNLKGINGWTPLHEAALGGFMDVTLVLLAHDADLDAKDDFGLTPLQEAEQRTGFTAEADLLRHPALTRIRLAISRHLIPIISLAGCFLIILGVLFLRLKSRKPLVKVRSDSGG